MKSIKHIQIIVITLLINLISVTSAQERFIDYVDPFIGTAGEGHTFPGATVPHGMVKIGPDCKGHSNSGYIPGGIIEGFSHTHVSGTGGGAKYGNILVKPWVGDIDLNDEGSGFSNEIASAGYYSAFLDNQGVKAELTTTAKTAMHRYTFPGSTRSAIIIDAGHFLHFGEQWGEAQSLVGSQINILSANEIMGYNRVRHGWNFGGPYTVYFYARFSKMAESFGTFKRDSLSPGIKNQFDSGERTGAWFTYSTKDQDTLLVKIGISFISEEKAKQNLEEELPGWNFEATRKDAENEWEKILSKIRINGTEKQKKVFYSSLYRTFLMPVDRTGENPKWNSDNPYFDDFYAIWDTYRTPHPLVTILTPGKQVQMINSLLDIYLNEGYLPDARSGNDNGRTQGGSNADVLIYDAYVKGLEGIDYELALEAMLKNAEVPPGGDERKEGRGGLWDYNRLGYISTDYERAGSRTLEYAYCDYCIANLAKELGQMDVYEKYIRKAGNWLNLWDDDYESQGFRGFIMPRKSDGNWHENYYLPLREAEGGGTVKFDEFTTGYWNAFFYESSSWEYSFFVPHDHAGLIDACGGKQEYIQRLDTFFDNHYFQVSNEPGFLTPYLYSYAGRHDKTAGRIKQILRNNYHTGRDGIPGNDDSGSMAAWYVFNAMGFYPNAGQDVYLIGSPLFEYTEINLPNGSSFKIVANNLSDDNIYIQSARLNGKVYEKAWLTHQQVTNGGILELEMHKIPGSWGSKILPPSMSDKKNILKLTSK